MLDVHKCSFFDKSSESGLQSEAGQEAHSRIASTKTMTIEI
jgi:hypothetical protein